MKNLLKIVGNEIGDFFWLSSSEFRPHPLSVPLVPRRPPPPQPLPTAEARSFLPSSKYPCFLLFHLFLCHLLPRGLRICLRWLVLYLEIPPPKPTEQAILSLSVQFLCYFEFFLSLFNCDRFVGQFFFRSFFHSLLFVFPALCLVSANAMCFSVMIVHSKSLQIGF